MGQMRLVVALLICGGAGCAVAAAEEVPLPQPRPVPYADAPSVVTPPLYTIDEISSTPSECRTRLQTVAEITPLPILDGPGVCGGGDMVELNAVVMPDHTRIPIVPAATLRCPMAAALADWLRDDAAPHVAELGATLRSVENYDSYDCRGRNRVAGAKISEHGKGNAIDVRAFHLADGRRIELTDPKVDKPLREALRQEVCARFTTVLGPGSDGYHEGHVHLDLAERRNGYRICEWDVREPAPVIVANSAAIGTDTLNVPLPPPRPAALRAAQN